MAEMTAAQAVYKITEKIFIDPEVRQQIVALIEQQAAEIERLKCCGNCVDSSCSGIEKCDKWKGSKINV